MLASQTVPVNLVANNSYFLAAEASLHFHIHFFAHRWGRLQTLVPSN